MIRIRQEGASEAWATPASGAYFLRVSRSRDIDDLEDQLAAGEPPAVSLLGFDDRLHLSHRVVVSDDWPTMLGYQAILVRRGLDRANAQDRVVSERIDRLLSERDPEVFWRTFIPPRDPSWTPEERRSNRPLGYLEAKFPGRIPLDDVKSIEVPPAEIDEIRSWRSARGVSALIAEGH